MKHDIKLKEVVMEQDEFDRIEEKIGDLEKQNKEYEDAKGIIVYKQMEIHHRYYQEYGKDDITDDILENETFRYSETLSKDEILLKLNHMENADSRRIMLKKYLKNASMDCTRLKKRNSGLWNDINNMESRYKIVKYSLIGLAFVAFFIGFSL